MCCRQANLALLRYKSTQKTTAAGETLRLTFYEKR